ncbi:carboxypeptidase-like regulatory domain-containing protein [Hymenobacter radiodurans]|uniref:carboxypeptidase-like regulatory domain-containing protein n=1 Tax=Hymenobacter radiodurans TaxID=2496028 RepID=UPI001058BA4E|nr:carboxypeptidase-like regulatory domain-containing protein [Hymenobacter radiodurans]
MKKPVPKLSRFAIPAILCCLPFQPYTAAAASYANFLASSLTFQTPDVTINGRVTDENGEGLPGVNVVVKGTTNGTQTGADGSYTLTAPTMAPLSFRTLVTHRRKLPLAGALLLI